MLRDELSPHLRGGLMWPDYPGLSNSSRTVASLSWSLMLQHDAPV
ncbi:MAG: hypothetical protein ACW97V_18150 [Promethearchaeota archaeon]